MFKSYLMKNSYKYKDHVINFKKNMIRKINWIKGVRESLISKLVFHSSFKIFEPNDVIIKDGSIATSIVMIFSG
jgi:hypothetical protein